MRKAVAIGFGAVLLAIVLIETGKFVARHVAPRLAPILAVAFVLLLLAAVAYFLWHFFADPTRRLAERSRDELDYRVERWRTGNELSRRVASAEEELRVRLLTATAQVHERAARAVADSDLRSELEELKQESERVVMRAQSAHLARMLARYEAALFRLENAEEMTAAEKAAVLAEIRAVLADERPPEPPDSAPSRSASPDPPSPTARPNPPRGALEYRSPGGEPISVTPDGLRRLLASGALSDDDECRRVGMLDWTSVREILSEAPEE